jgi:hypothetical protein
MFWQASFDYGGIFAKGKIEQDSLLEWYHYEFHESKQRILFTIHRSHAFVSVHASGCFFGS